MHYFDIIYNFVAYQLQTNQFFSGAALTSMLMSSAYMLRSVPFNIINRVKRYIHYSVTVEQEDAIFHYLNEWTSDKYPRNLRHVELHTVSGEVQATHENDYIYFWYKGRRIRLSKTKQKLEAAKDIYNMHSRSYNISGYLAKKAINELVLEAVEYGKKKEIERRLNKKEVKVYAGRSWGGFTSVDNVKNKNFNELFLEGKEDLLGDLEKFKASKEKYNKLKIPFKRGYLFYGKPGNGKSSLAYAIADYLKYDIYIIDMSVISASEFVNSFNNIPSQSVVVIEDIDSYYDKRTHIGENKVSYSTFINALSGIANREGVITVITTNKIDTIDEALLREGRCDFKFEVDNPTKELVEQFVSHVFDTKVELTSYSGELPFVKVQDIVLRNINDLDSCIQELQNN